MTPSFAMMIDGTSTSNSAGFYAGYNETSEMFAASSTRDASTRRLNTESGLSIRTDGLSYSTTCNVYAPRQRPQMLCDFNTSVYC